MLGWWVTIREQQPEDESFNKENVIASWEISIGGIDWIDMLMAEGKLKFIRNNSWYPNIYAAYPKDIIAHISTAPPPGDSLKPLIKNADYTDYDGYIMVGDEKHITWIKVIKFDYKRLKEYPLEKQLLIEVWDLS